jgi:hypothetical protein
VDGGPLYACENLLIVRGIIEDLRYLLNRLIVQSIGATVEQSMFGSEDVATARKALEEHARSNKGAQTEYELIVSLLSSQPPADAVADRPSRY